MDAKLIKSAGAIAGIGGIGLIVLYLTFKDVISASFIPQLAPQHAFIVIASIVALTFFGAVIAIFVWFIGQSNRYITVRARFFLLLVSMILVFTLGFAYVVVEQLDKPSTTAGPLEQAIALVKEGRLEEAEGKLGAAAEDAPRSPEPWYWRSRIALARDSLETSLSLVDVGLKRDQAHPASLVLKAKVMLLLGGDNRAAARKFVTSHAPSSDRLRRWGECIEANRLYEALLTTDSEVEAVCPT